MSSLTVDCHRHSSGPLSYDVIRFLVDGRDMLGLVHEVEAEQRKLVEPEGGMEGSYWNLDHDVYTPEYLLGRRPDSYLEGTGARTVLLDCQCGVPGCWPFLVRIVEMAGLVTWEDFAQGWMPWDYSRLGPFSFDRGQYLGEVARIQGMGWPQSTAGGSC